MAAPTKSLTRRFDFSGGLNSRASEMELEANQSPSLRNVELGRTGALKRRAGMASYGTVSGSGGVNGLFRYRSASGNISLLGFRGANCYSETTAGHGDFDTSEGTGYNSASTWIGSQYDNNLFMANGQDPSLVWDGTDLVDFVSHDDASLPTEWSGTNQPLGFALGWAARNEKMFAWNAGSDYPSRLWWSKDTDPFTWDIVVDSSSDGGYLDFLVDNGEAIQSVYPMHDLLLVFKETACGVFMYGDDSGNPLVLKQVLPVGCSSHHSIVGVGRDLYFWSDRGPVKMSGIQEYGDLAPERGISHNVLTEIDKANWAQADRIMAVHRRDEDMVEWYFAPSGSTRNTSSLTYNIVTGAVVPTTGREVKCVLTYADSGGDYVTLAGDSSGNVNQLGVGLTDEGVAIDTEYVTAWDWAGDIGADKRLLRVTFFCQDDYDVDVELQWDHDGGTWHSLGNLRDLNNTGLSQWDVGTWDDSTVFMWDQGQSGVVVVHPTGRGNRYRLRFTADSTNTSFHLLGYEAMLSMRPNR